LLDPTPASLEQGAARRTPWRLLALLIAMSGVSALSLNILVPAIPSMVTNFETDPATVQLTVSLYLLGLDPIAETLAEPNSYGFRRERSPAEALDPCQTVLSLQHSAPWILEGDIRACFDGMSHEWVLAHIPLDKATAGFLDADNRQAFACNAHFWEGNKYITGWVDFAASERLRAFATGANYNDLFGGEYARPLS